jgi:hypothetical protein
MEEEGESKETLKKMRLVKLKKEMKAAQDMVKGWKDTKKD